ncbi:MAG TPA: hypothetical protein VJM33_04375 [Microthrixaceae bacterium]|nr:hypothetical protein [Microthrixaceae bacterium]
MDSTLVSTPETIGVRRSPADRRMRKLLRLSPDGPRESIFGAHGVVSKSIAISAMRCLVTYVAIPLLGPIIGLSKEIGPWVGIALSTVTIVAIIAATRRFFAADHKWRWWYASLGSVLIVLAMTQAAIDIVHLATR